MGEQLARSNPRTYLRKVVICVCLLVVAWPALATTITVTNTHDSGAGSLREAIADAAPGDTIDFALTYPAMITLSSTLSITQSLTIVGPGSANLAISGNRTVQVFAASAGVTVAISGLSIAGYNFPGEGGGIYNAGILTLSHSVVGGYADLGGSIYNAGTLTLIDSTVSGYATVAGGIANVGTLTVTSSTISGYAVASAGGIENDGGTVTISNSTISHNGIDDFCAGAIWNKGGMLTVTNSTFSNNYSSCGGAIENDGTLIVTNSTFFDNQADIGGAITSSGTLTLTSNTFSDTTGGSSPWLVGLRRGFGNKTLNP